MLHGRLVARPLAAAPAAMVPYLRLMRLQAPIGTWLYLLPGWWAIALSTTSGVRLLDLVLFGLAAVFMRGAVCTVNDIVDRDIDARVRRTASRPLPSGAVGVGTARVFTAVQLAVTLALLIPTGGRTVAAVAASFPLFVIYPYVKKFSNLPQFWLGLCFNTYAFAGSLAVTGRITAPVLALWGAGVFWTIGYDTIYGHQDKEDDRRIGVGSTSLLFGAATRAWVSLFYALTVAGLLWAGTLAGAGWGYYVLLVPFAGHLVRQLVTLDIDSPDRCLRLFVSNRWAGLIVFAAALLAQSH
ncbi:4-hydroxybenzoate octaprenyltransferase [Streptomyces sp. J2-1]|uniref:4-hydroxybenzoate octaprenyltransferase n=1 Tax=Streptomyces corallincola TaxID=2851888 RepID=UPI001C38E12E|nr:4-hydroxybenzoate octaprenyltransferase [Streptomyces corallincola]MBV2353831.1 4-hydroxybenzoate octaprenyltransferase [Streptomyces corallincola]